MAHVITEKCREIELQRKPTTTINARYINLNSQLTDFTDLAKGRKPSMSI